MARKNVKYRKHQPQRGNPMWRDPSHAGGGKGCAVVALALVAAPVVAVVAGAVTLLG